MTPRRWSSREKKKKIIALVTHFRPHGPGGRRGVVTRGRRVGGKRPRRKSAPRSRAGIKVNFVLCLNNNNSKKNKIFSADLVRVWWQCICYEFSKKQLLYRLSLYTPLWSTLVGGYNDIILVAVQKLFFSLYTRQVGCTLKTSRLVKKENWL